MRLFVCTIIGLMLFSCGGSSLEDDSQIESIELIEKILKEITIESIEEDGLKIEIFNTPESVDSIRHIMTLTDDLNENDLDTKGIGERYLLGEDYLKNEIIDVLYNGTNGDKQNILWDLNPTYYDHSVQLNDEEIITAIYDNLHVDSIEASVITHISDQKFPGYLDRLEEHLITGSSSNEGILIKTLAMEGRSMASLDFFENSVLDWDWTSYGMAQALKGLRELRRSDNVAICKKIDEICFKIYRLGKIDDEAFEELDDEYAYNNPAQNLLEIFFEFGKDEVLPIAMRFGDKPSVKYSALNFLIRMEGEKHRKQLIELMKYTDSYNSALNLVPAYYKTTKDERMVHSAITNFELLYGEDFESSKWRTKKFLTPIRTIFKDSTEQFLKGKFKDDELAAFVLRKNRIMDMSVQDILNAFADLGFSNAINSDLTESDENYSDNVYLALGESGHYFWNDSEDYNLINDSEFLINEFINHSQGKLIGMEFGVDYFALDSTYFYAVLGEKAYKTTIDFHEEYDSIYFIVIHKFINGILEDIQSEALFQQFEYDSFIFGKKSTVDTLIEDFQL